MRCGRCSQVQPRAWIVCSLVQPLGVQRADPYLQGGVRVAKSRGQNVGRPQIIPLLVQESCRRSEQ